MTVSSEVSTAGPFYGNGSNITFPYGFKVLDAKHLRAVFISASGDVSDLSLENGDYTVTGVGNEAGGNVVKATPLLTGQTLTIVRRLPLTQDTSLENQGAYYPEVVEQRFDQIVMQIQAVKEEVGRALVVSPGKTPINADIITDAEFNGERAEAAAARAVEAANRNLVFAKRSDAVAAQIDPDVHSVSLKGNMTEGDGKGGLFIDTNNGNPNTFVSADSRTWYRVVSSNPKLFEFGAKGDFTTDDTVSVNSAAAYATTANIKIDGLNKTYLVTALPDVLLFDNASFKVSPLEFPTDDTPNLDVMRVTKTMFCAGWSQDMACVHRPFNDGVSEWIILPFKYGYGDYYNTSRYGCVISFDGEGNDWSEPFILLDYHPNPSVYGYNIFSMGIKHKRLVMAVEERNVSDRKLAALYMYDRPLDFCIHNTNNGIGLTSGSSIAKVPIEKHGLVAGDKIYFSGVTGTGVNGLGGLKTVQSVVDENTILVDKGVASTVTDPNTGGTSWIVSASFFQQSWRITPMPTFPNGSGSNLSEVHSFSDDSLNPQGFWFGYHNGENSPREVGTIYVNNFYSVPSFTKDRIQTAFEPNAGEPSIRQHNGTLYMITRGLSATASEGGCSFNYKDAGGSWVGYQLPGRIHHSSVPFEIHDGQLYIFSSERSEDEWLPNAPDNRWKPTRPRTLLLTVPLSEARAGNFSNFRQQIVHYGRFTGESIASGNGVGTTVKTATGIWYFWGSQDWRHKGQYSVNPTPDLPSQLNPWASWGIQEDLFAARIKLADRPANNYYEDRSADNRSLGVVRQENKMLLEAPVDINNGVRFVGRVVYRQSPVYRIASDAITITDENVASIIVDTEASAATDNLATVNFSKAPMNGSIFIFQAQSSARDVTYKHGIGNIYLNGAVDVTLPTGLSSLTFQYLNGTLREIARAIM